MASLIVKKFLKVFEELNYPVLRQQEEKGYHLNIVGVRNRFARTNYFDDVIYVYYEEDAVWVQEVFSATTYPGAPSLLNPISSKGSAILVPGQYVYKKGKHKGKYDALVQKEPVTVYRDNTRDLVFNLENKETGFFGINIHRASFGAKLVGPDGYGCQVIKEGFDRFMRLVNKSLELRENKFIYTLIEL